MKLYTSLYKWILKRSKYGFHATEKFSYSVANISTPYGQLTPQGTPDMCYSQNGILESWTLISVCVFLLFYGVSFMIGEQ
jgi:hypothetical protein